MAALSEASSLKPALPKKDAEALIQSLVSDYWITNRYALDTVNRSKAWTYDVVKTRSTFPWTSLNRGA